MFQIKSPLDCARNCYLEPKTEQINIRVGEALSVRIGGVILFLISRKVIVLILS